MFSVPVKRPLVYNTELCSFGGMKKNTCRPDWDLLIKAVTEKVFNICMNSNCVLHRFSSAVIFEWRAYYAFL